ncbi:MAG: cytochrome c peroxidase [Nitrospinota bacterium]
MKSSKKFMFLVFAFATVLMFTFAGTALAEGDPDFDTPLGFLPPPPYPVDNPTKAHNVWPSKMGPKQELGYLTFFDPKLSGDQGPSACGDCHSPEQGWGTNESHSKGYAGTMHWRNSQTIVNNSYFQKLFWGGSSPSLEAQAPSAARAARAGNVERDQAEARLRLVPEYVKRFNEVYGTRWPVLDDAWRSIAAFERYMSQLDTPFDKYMKGDKKAMSAAAIRGMEIFKGKANCFECHNTPFFTDEKYYNLGVPRGEGLDGGEDPEDATPLVQVTLRWEIYGNKGNSEWIFRSFKDDAGMWFRDKNLKSRGKFRTAPIRFTKFTAPYMHHGQLFTLREVIDFYDKGGGENEFTKPLKTPYGEVVPGTKTPILKKLNLTEEEKNDLEQFILALSNNPMQLPKPKIPQFQRMADWMPKK